MVDISQIPGLTGSILQLLKEAGLGTVESLLAHKPGEVLDALSAANRGKEIPVRVPSEMVVLSWQSAARALVEVVPMEPLPAAKKVRSADLEAAGIEVDAIPVAKVVDSPPAATPAVGSGKALSSAEGAKAPSAPRQAPSKKEGAATRPVAGRPVVRPPVSPAIAALGTKESPPRTRPSTEDEKARSAKDGRERAGPSRVELGPRKRFRPLEEVKSGKPPVERRNRGMSHPDALRVRLAAVVTVLALTASVLTALALVGAFVMVQFKGWELHWTIVLLVLVFPISLFAYLAVGIKARCRLCGQRLFVPKHCLKHERARRSLFGYTFAVARDAVFLAGYRCMLCGTKTRLRD